MRMLVVTVFSTFLSALVISNAYVEKKQFYPTVVYLLSSNRSLGVLYLQSFLMVWFICKFLKVIFFGTLRAAEVEVCCCCDYTRVSDDMVPLFHCILPLFSSI